MSTKTKQTLLGMTLVIIHGRALNRTHRSRMHINAGEQVREKKSERKKERKGGRRVKWPWHDTSRSAIIGTNPSAFFNDAARHLIILDNAIHRDTPTPQFRRVYHDCTGALIIREHFVVYLPVSSVIYLIN